MRNNKLYFVYELTWAFPDIVKYSYHPDLETAREAFRSFEHKDEATFVIGRLSKVSKNVYNLIQTCDNLWSDQKLTAGNNSSCFFISIYGSS
jgi:hypothetical protein